MKRIDGPDPAVDLFGAGKPGFREQVPGVSLATGLTAKWFNAVQESIVRTIEAAGLALSEADMDQFVAALSVLDGAARDAAIIAAAIDATNKAAGARATAIATAELDATNKANAARVAAGLDATAKVAALIPSGTRMLFQQSTAPVGWTKDVSHHDKALRLVNGAVGSGGDVNFSTAFVVGTVGGHALTVAEIPAHSHGAPVYARDGSSAHLGDGGAASTFPSVTTGETGGGQAHTHSINLAIKYVDIIIAVKD